MLYVIIGYNAEKLPLGKLSKVTVLKVSDSYYSKSCYLICIIIKYKVLRIETYGRSIIKQNSEQGNSVYSSDYV